MGKNQKKPLNFSEGLADVRAILMEKQGNNTAPVNGHYADSAMDSHAPVTPEKRQPRKWYDEKLKNEEPGSHNPNPFDFVFLSNTPKHYTSNDLENSQDLVSGSLTVELKALTPLHIIGKQTPVRGRVGKKIERSAFYSQGGTPCIPGSSIRGMLRSFMETITNGWVSQAQEKYEIEKDGQGPQKRHITFASFKPVPHEHGCIGSATHTMGPAIPEAYKAKISEEEKMDIATYLFGMVDSTKGGGSLYARAGKVVIEDALLSEDLLKKDCKMIDIVTEGNAFMGGPAPRANWWHMRPREVWNRNVREKDWQKKPSDKQNLEEPVAQIVGDGFWGRKFYYHQVPGKCIEKYNPSCSRNNLYEFNMECLDKDQTASFRLDFHRLPKHLLQLLCSCLCPSGKIRHKLGYGKAFGYGSVEFSITGAKWRVENKAGWPGSLEDKKEEIESIVSKGWGDEPVRNYVDEQALKELARILTWEPKDEIIFTYPPYDKKNFKKVVMYKRYNNFNKKNNVTIPTGTIQPVTETEALNAAEYFWKEKKTVHFLLYQARAKGYDKIRRRTP